MHIEIHYHKKKNELKKVCCPQARWQFYFITRNIYSNVDDTDGRHNENTLQFYIMLCKRHRLHIL